MAETNNSQSNPEPPLMDLRLLKACRQGDHNALTHLLDQDTNILFSVTPHGNNCLHLAAMLGHDKFAQVVWSKLPPLFSWTNKDGETPLIAALMAANQMLAFDMLTAASQLLQPDIEGRQLLLKEMLLKIDKRGDNALHHAIRNGFQDFAIELLDKEPQLSEHMKRQESEDREPLPLAENKDSSHQISVSTESTETKLKPPPPQRPAMSEEEYSWHPILESPESLRDHNIISESPMFMAARKGYSMLVERLLKIPSSAEYGPGGYSALEAATDDPDIFKVLLRARPKLAQRITGEGLTPLTACISEFETVRMLLENNPSLAYAKNPRGTYQGYTPFLVAAQLGLVPIAKEIITAYPDSAYITEDESMANALHIAIRYERRSFVNFIVRTPQLHRLINQVDHKGQLPLHIAAEMCDPEILNSLIAHKRQDCTAVNAMCRNALEIVTQSMSVWKSLKWNTSFNLLLFAIPIRTRMMLAIPAIVSGQEEYKSLMERYASNTSLVASLLATITFAAAFTVPGGFSNDSSDAGIPIFAKKAALQVFFISDTIAMCSSLVVAFLCILMAWDDFDYLTYYREITRPLMWCAFTSAAVAFGTGVFTMMASKKSWLAILILVISCFLPFLCMIFGDWPQIRIRLRLRLERIRKFRWPVDLVPNL